MVDRLRVLLYGQLAATLDTGGGQLSTPSSVDFTPRIARLSAAWTHEPPLDTLSHWLEACLPENGSRQPFEQRAARLKHDRRLPPTVTAPADLLWANTDAEYPGAVGFEREDEPEETDPADGYVRLSDEDIGRRLHAAWRLATQVHKGRPPSFPERRSSLSGIRGKIGLAKGPDGAWYAAIGRAHNTWIGKRELDDRVPGEAGLESICQRTLAELGLPAAQTLSRVFAGEQAVLSERSDRYLDPATGTVATRHQEEFCQAAGWPSPLKYDWGRANEPRWERAYALLDRWGTDPQREQATLTAILAATWALGHVDLHRRNLGFLHGPPDDPFAISIAPMYDVSSGIGVERKVPFELAIGIARQRNPRGPVQWLEHARATDQDLIGTIAIVSGILEDLPDALASARRHACDHDENIQQGSVDHRSDALNTYVARRAKSWTSTLDGLRKHRARGLNPDAAAIARNLIRLDEAHGNGDVRLDAHERGPIKVLHVSPKDQKARSAGTTNSIRTIAEAVILARKKQPWKIPELERTLEKERAQALARGVEMPS